VIRVVIADDHHLVRQGIRALLEKASDIKVVGEAEDGQKALDLVERLAPDVLLIDIAMPRMDGMQAIERVRLVHAATRTIVLSMYSDEALVRQALRSGASGYVLKRSVVEELLLAVRAASRGEIYLSPAVAPYIVADLQTDLDGTRASRPVDRLTPREREVLQLVAEGNTNTATGQILHISVKTVEKHRSSLMSKLDVHDLAGLMRVAIKHGLVFLDE
jgi:DNA-binding NarL/FixJ family response regulator